jgi:(+)-trans-carveol dehydrogenase
MTKDFKEKVVFVSGAARGQGRSHAVRFAELGARIVAIDVCSDIDTTDYPGATEEDFAETERLIKAAGSESVLVKGDTRDLGAVESTVQQGLSRFGRIDVVLGNAGICSIGPAWELSPERWREMLDINLTGVYNVARAAIPSMIEGGRGGSIVLTASVWGLRGMAGIAHYSAAKHGVVGLTRSLAIELGEHRIRVNCVCPTNVDTTMIQNESVYKLFRPEDQQPGRPELAEAMGDMHLFPELPWVDVDDISNAVVWLSSDAARYITGVALPIDAGLLTK